MDGGLPRRPGRFPHRGVSDSARIWMPLPTACRTTRVCRAICENPFHARRCAWRSILARTPKLEIGAAFLGHRWLFGCQNARRYIFTSLCSVEHVLGKSPLVPGRWRGALRQMAGIRAGGLKGPQIIAKVNRFPRKAALRARSRLDAYCPSDYSRAERSERGTTAHQGATRRMPS